MPIAVFSHPNLYSKLKKPNTTHFPFIGVGTETLDKMKGGYLVKVNDTFDAVLPALPADDADLFGIIVELPDPAGAPDTVAVAMDGSFNENMIHYANAWPQGASPTPLSAAAIDRLHCLGIFLDPACAA